MSYNKKTWETGDTITAAALNNLENGCEDANAGPYALTGALNGETGAMTLANVTASELYAVAETGKTITITLDLGGAEIAIICGITAQKAGINYDFAMIASNGAVYVTGHLEGTDAVVLTPA